MNSEGKFTKGNMIVFICLCMIFVGTAGRNLLGVSRMVNSSRSEVLLTSGEGYDENEESIFWKVISGGFLRELSLIDKGNMKLDKVYRGDYKVSEFDYDYGEYEDNRHTESVFNSSLCFNYPKDDIQVLIYNTHTGEGYIEGLIN